MVCQSYANNLITHNNWKTLEVFLSYEIGHIGKSTGGRYSHRPYLEGGLDINQVCWSVYYASRAESFNLIPVSDRLTVLRIIKELRRLHDETEDALSNASYIEAIATHVYDLHEKIFDGFQPIERLEYRVLPVLIRLSNVTSA
jgi:hypothetical protein